MAYQVQSTSRSYGQPQPKDPRDMGRAKLGKVPSPLGSPSFSRSGRFLDALAAALRPRLARQLLLREVSEGSLLVARSAQNHRAFVGLHTCRAPLNACAAPQLVHTEGGGRLQLAAGHAPNEPFARRRRDARGRSHCPEASTMGSGRLHSMHTHLAVLHP